jgi:hypothetical protein
MSRCLICDEPLTSGYFNNNKVTAKLCHRLGCKKTHQANLKRRAYEAKKQNEQSTQATEINHA